MDNSTTYGRLWTRGDMNGFLGLFTNIMTNIIVMTALLIYSVGLPVDMVIGKIIPGVGISITVGNIYYAYMARKLAKKEKRNNVTALPYGTSVGHMFVVTFMIIGPVFWTTHNPNLAWVTGMAWCVLEALVEVAGAYCASYIRKVTPKAAMLGTIAGLSLALIAMKPIAMAFEYPIIAFASIALFLIGFFGKKRMPFGIPAAIWMVVLGIITGWATGFMKMDALQASLSNVHFSLPIPYFSGLIDGLKNVAPYLITALPMGIGNAVETLNNIETASAAGDNFDTKEAMICNGVGSFIGGVFGSPFPTCVYLGHPGWKSMGACAGYSLATGIVTLLVCVTAFTPVLMAIIPLPALVPILLYVALVMAALAFQESPPRHAPAIAFAVIPWFANWAITIINNTLKVAGVNNPFAGDTIAKLHNTDILYMGLLSLNNGAVVVSMIFGSLAVFIIDSKMKNAIYVTLIASVLSFFGFIHGSNIGINMAPIETLGYLIMAAVIGVVHFYNVNLEKKKPLTNEVNKEAGL